MSQYCCPGIGVGAGPGTGPGLGMPGNGGSFGSGKTGPGIGIFGNAGFGIEGIDGIEGRPGIGMLARRPVARPRVARRIVRLSTYPAFGIGGWRGQPLPQGFG
jgi:hypothetical protein